MLKVESQAGDSRNDLRKPLNIRTNSSAAINIICESNRLTIKKRPRSPMPKKRKQRN
jgi:hypothetical protein